MKIDSFIEIRKKSIKNLLIITTVSLFFSTNFQNYYNYYPSHRSCKGQLILIITLEMKNSVAP